MRTSLARATPAAVPAPALLDPAGAAVVLGGCAGAPVAPLAPSARTLFGPRGAVLAAAAGPLVVADTGHHRLLVWRRAPATDDAPADLVIGQPDFDREGQNGRAAPGAATLNLPCGVAAADGMLAVADAWNHRVLLWRELPRRSNQPADVVLGQADFDATAANRGRATPDAGTLQGCCGVALHGGRLYVADTGNRRVLIWHRVPERNGAPADAVLGQHDFVSRDASAARALDAVGMRWPHAIAVAHGRLYVADAGTSRVMVWRGEPARDGAPCDLVLGQRSPEDAQANRGEYLPTAATLNMPYAVAADAGRVIVADTANSRLLGFDAARLATGVAAGALAGQDGFHDKGENRWRAAARDGLCWPYGVTLSGATAVIADSGNNRVLLWPTT